MGHPSRNFEGSNPGANADCGGPALEVSERNNINYWPRDGPCNILSKMCLLSAVVLRICLRLNEKVMDYFLWWRQHNIDADICGVTIIILMLISVV